MLFITNTHVSLVKLFNVNVNVLYHYICIYHLCQLHNLFTDKLRHTFTYQSMNVNVNNISYTEIFTYFFYNLYIIFFILISFFVSDFYYRDILFYLDVPYYLDTLFFILIHFFLF